MKLQEFRLIVITSSDSSLNDFIYLVFNRIQALP